MSDVLSETAGENERLRIRVADLEVVEQEYKDFREHDDGSYRVVCELWDKAQKDRDAALARVTELEEMIRDIDKMHRKEIAYLDGRIVGVVAQRDAATAALANYGTHWPACPSPKAVCTCGLAILLAATEAR